MGSETAFTVDEKAAVLYNIRYANRVLFRQAIRDRQLQIRTIMSSNGLFQTQGFSNYCGLCCINNILGPTEDGRDFPVSIQDMDHTADVMWLGMLQNPGYGIVARIEPLRDREGFYSWEVIQEVLENRGVTVIRINSASLKDMCPSTVVQLLLNQVNSESCDLIIRLKSTEHWLSVRLLRTHAIIFDSKKQQPTLTTIGSTITFISVNAETPGAVYAIKYQRDTVRTTDNLEQDREGLAQETESHFDHEIGSAGLNVPTNAPESENEQQQAQYFYEGTDEESEQKSQLETDQHCNSIPETDSQQIPVTDCESQPAAVDKTDEHDDGQNQGQDNSFAKLKNRVEGTDYEEETSKEESCQQNVHRYVLRANPKQKRRRSYWYALDNKKTRKRRNSFKVTSLPTEILTIILKEVILEDGDIAYRNLSLVCKTFQAICRNEQFRVRCHLEWLESLRPKEYWLLKRNVTFYKPFQIRMCFTCNETYKEEGPGFFGGQGKRGEFMGFYENKLHSGYCSVLCRRLSQPDWDGDVEESSD